MLGRSSGDCSTTAPRRAAAMPAARCVCLLLAGALRRFAVARAALVGLGGQRGARDPGSKRQGGRRPPPRAQGPSGQTARAGRGPRCVRGSDLHVERKLKKNFKFGTPTSACVVCGLCAALVMKDAYLDWSLGFVTLAAYSFRCQIVQWTVVADFGVKLFEHFFFHVLASFLLHFGAKGGVYTWALMQEPRPIVIACFVSRADDHWRLPFSCRSPTSGF